MDASVLDPTVIGSLALLAVLGMIALHVPIGAAMAIGGFIGTGLIIGWEPAVAVLGIDPAQQIASSELAVIALFLLMGTTCRLSMPVRALKALSLTKPQSTT